MASVQHAFRRGHVFWWRRQLRLSSGVRLEVRLSLKTSDRAEARQRGAALTAATGGVLMTLETGTQACDARPTLAELRGWALAQYGIVLAQFCDQQRQRPSEAKAIHAANLTWSDYYQRVVEQGDHKALMPGEQEAWRFRNWDDERIAGLVTAIKIVDDDGQILISQRTIDFYLRSAGYVPNNGLRGMVRRQFYPAYRDASLDADADFRNLPHMSASAMQLNAAERSTVKPGENVVPPRPGQSGVSALQIPAEWRSRTVSEAAELFISSSPAMFEHRGDGKRAASTVGEQTLRQIRWAAALLERSMESRPLWTLSQADLKQLDSWFDRLPVHCGKAPWHRNRETTLAAICTDMEEKIEAETYEADVKGLHGGTTNKHFRKLAQVHAFMRTKVEAAGSLDFSKFMVEDDEDDRDKRAAYTVEQGIELFSLPPWTGHANNDRLSRGDFLTHDSLFYVLLIVWYTGVRREEVCKLLVSDLEATLDGAWHFTIAPTKAGGVKNHSAVRSIAICDELIRLGLISYIEAVKAAGHEAIFPELVSEREKAKKGDTFYKLWWVYVAPYLSGLKRGQALHAARHTVSTELKEAEVSVEARNDLLGHKGKGEGETRYAKAIRMTRLRTLVNKIPVVTGHLPDCTGIMLLPPRQRCPRPARDKNV